MELKVVWYKVRVSGSQRTQSVRTDSFAPFSRAGASGETGDFSTTDLSIRLDPLWETSEAVFFVLIRNICSLRSRNMSKDIELK